VIADPLTIVTSEGIPLIVLSPHLDDAVLSCGALLTHASRRVPVTVMTFFTEARPPPHSRSTRRYLRLTGAADAQDLYAARRAEDKEALEHMGVACRHIGLPDGQFRRKPGHLLTGKPRWPERRLAELSHIYPTYRFHLAAGRISRYDDVTLRCVVNAIEAAAAAEGSALVLAPLGVGGHADHLLVRTAAERVPSRVIYYSDFPYNQRHTAKTDFVERRSLVQTAWRRGLDEKAELIRAYRSQVPSLFPGGRIPLVPEVYLVPGEPAGGSRGADDVRAGERQ
jgi:LmbE family N-acetylglucosaminyl deacetylase